MHDQKQAAGTSRAKPGKARLTPTRSSEINKLRHIRTTPKSGEKPCLVLGKPACWRFASALLRRHSPPRSPPTASITSPKRLPPSGNPQPTIPLDRGRPTAVLQDFSLVSLTMEHSAVDGSLNVISEQLRGDITLTGAGSALTQGTGSMTLSDLRIDHLGKQVFAKVNGSASTETAIFSFDAPAFVLAETAFTPILTCLPGRPHCKANLESLSAHPVLSNLQFTEQGRTLWDQSFQLTPLGKVTMDAVGGLGKMSVTAVPEASTWALMLIGLAGIGLARRRLSA